LYKRRHRINRATDRALHLELALLLTLSVACDVFGQTSFKLGAMDAPPAALRLLPQPAWVAVGLAIYGLEIFVWLRVLALAPLTIAAPIASLNYIGVILMSRWLFDEQVSLRQWAGAAFITAGSVAVALSGG
jgi:undecaprenyl phosphate-alpha-L-ara4N flippase subunit ArnE